MQSTADVPASSLGRLLCRLATGAVTNAFLHPDLRAFSEGDRWPTNPMMESLAKPDLSWPRSLPTAIVNPCPALGHDDGRAVLSVSTALEEPLLDAVGPGDRRALDPMELPRYGVDRRRTCDRSKDGRKSFGIDNSSWNNQRWPILTMKPTLWITKSRRL
jgi:hypothetical protein